MLKLLNYRLLFFNDFFKLRINFLFIFISQIILYFRGRFAQVRRCVHKTTSAECAAKVSVQKKTIYKFLNNHQLKASLFF